MGMNLSAQNIIGILIMVVGVTSVWRTQMVVDKLPFKVDEEKEEDEGNIKLITRVKIVGFGLVTIGFLILFL